MKAVLASMFFTLYSVVAFAQQGNSLQVNNAGTQSFFEDELLNQLDQLNIVNFSPDVITSNSSQIYQNGNSNNARIDQINTSYEGPNEALLLQNGNLNSTYIDMNGDNNQAEAIQDGNNNSYELDLDGSGINTQILQKGNHNNLLQELSVDDRSYVIIQEGNNNNIDQRDWDPVSTGIKIHQMGSGMDLIIRNSSIIP